MAWRTRRLGAIGLGASLVVGCVVVRPPTLAERPRWRLTDDAAYDAGCVLAQAFVRKSGKAGFGVTLRLRSRAECSFQITGSRLVFQDGPTLAAVVDVQPPVVLPGRSQIYAWVPIRFDNDAAWNDDHDHARLELDVSVAGVPAPTWGIGVHQQ